MEELSLNKNFITYFKIRSRGTLYISGFLIMLLSYGNFSKVVGSEENNIMFRVNSDVRMISLISKERRNTSNSTWSIIVSKLHER